MLLTAYLPINQTKLTAIANERPNRKNATIFIGDFLSNAFALGLMVGAVSLAAHINNKIHRDHLDNISFVANATAVGAAFFFLAGMLLGNVYNKHYPNLATWAREQVSLVNIIEVAVLTIGATIAALSLGAAILAPHPNDWGHIVKMGTVGGTLLWSTIFVFTSLGEKLAKSASDSEIELMPTERKQKVNLSFKFSALLERCSPTEDESMAPLFASTNSYEASGSFVPGYQTSGTVVPH